MKCIYTRFLTLLTLLLIFSQVAQAQKMTPKIQRRAKAAARQTLLGFKEDINHVYHEGDDGTPTFNEAFIGKTKQWFYNPESSSMQHIHRSFLDTKDTLLRDAPEMMTINSFLDTLVSLYCNPDSCELGAIFDFTDITIDTLDYYVDPEIIAINMFFDLDFYGDLYAPHLAKYMADKKLKKEEEDDEAIFFVEDYESDWQTMQPDAAMATFLITRDGDKFTSVKIYKIFKYDPFSDELPDLRTIIRPVIASRNKMYISAMAGGGYSKARALFENTTQFESLSDFRLGYNFDISFDYFLNDGPRKITYGYSAGLGYSKYNASVSIASFQQSFDDYSVNLAKDYIKNVSANDISQELSLNYIDIPVSFKLKYKWRNYLHFYGDAGLAFSYLFAPDINPAGDGTISYSGTFMYDFPQGNQTVTFDNVPYYGFTTYNDLMYSDEDPGFKSINVSALVNAGAMFWLSQRMAFNVELMYRYGFINLVDNNLSDQFILSQGEGKINNIFTNCNALHTNAFMLNAGVSFFLKSKK